MDIRSEVTNIFHGSERQTDGLKRKNVELECILIQFFESACNKRISKR